MMRGYAETRGCRRVFLLDYFGEHPDAPVRELRSLRRQPPPDDATGADPFPVDSRVAHRTFGAGVVIRTESDRVTVCSTRWDTARCPWRHSRTRSCSVRSTDEATTRQAHWTP